MFGMLMGRRRQREAPGRDAGGGGGAEGLFCCAEGDANARGYKAVLVQQVPVLQHANESLHASLT